MKQTIYEQSATPKYDVGKRIYEGDRVFRYCHAIADLTDKWGVGNSDTLHEQNTAVLALAGALDLTVVLAAADASMAKDYFKDGYINIHTVPVVQVCLRIKGNDKDDGTNFTLHLKDPLRYDVPAGALGFADIHANIYRNIKFMGGGDDYVSIVAIPLIPVTSGNYFWGQTWGPVIAAAGFGTGIGAGVNERAVWFKNDGSIGAGSDLAPGTGFQYAGFMLGDTTLGDDIFFMLQLAP